MLTVVAMVTILTDTGGRSLDSGAGALILTGRSTVGLKRIALFFLKHGKKLNKNYQLNSVHVLLGI